LKSDISTTALILARRVGNLIDKRFGCKLVVARSDTAPGMNAHATGFAHVLGPHIADAVERLIEAARADVVLATRRLEAWGRRDRIYVLGHEAVVPADEIAVGIETGLEHVMGHRPRTGGNDVICA
jgi:hypothetical protein